MVTNILDKLLITLSVRVHALALCEIQRGWRLRVDPMEAVIIHHVLAGSGTLQAGEATPIAFFPGSVIIVPARLPLSFGEAAEVVGEAAASEHYSLLDDGMMLFTAGDGSRDILIACGTISATYGGALGLFEYLREPFVEDFSHTETLEHVFALLISELTHPGLGTQALTESLMKQCLILVLRQHLRRLGVDSPFFATLQDPRLARAIVAVLESPSAPHTVTSLAAIAGMSRSSFAERFPQVFGQGPMEFVQKVRLRLAAHLLSTSDLPIKLIANSIGYASRSHFSKAFAAVYGADPSTYRSVGGFDEAELQAIELISPTVPQLGDD